MLHRGSIPQVTFRFFLLCYALITLAALAYSHLVYRGEKHSIEDRLAYSTAAIRDYMETRHANSARVLAQLAPKVQAANGEVETVRDLIDSEVNMRGLPMRVAWSNRDKTLVVGTAIGIFTPKTDRSYLEAYRQSLAHRDYIAAASANPSEIHVSNLHTHAITGRSFFAIAYGVADANGAYLGTLADIVEQTSVTAFLSGVLQGEQILGELRLPSGKKLYSTLTIGLKVAGETLEGGYVLKTTINPKLLASLWQQHLAEMALILLTTTLLFVVLYQGFAQYLTRPVQEAMQLLFGVDARQRNDLALHALLPRIQHLRDMADNHDALADSLQDRERKLAEAAEAMQGIRREYYGTLGSLGDELQQAFDAINAYGEQYRQIARGEDDEAYQQHFEVEEFGLNMKFISNALYLLCQANYGEFKTKAETLPVDALVADSLHRCHEVIEEKTVTIRQQEGQVFFRHDAALLGYLVDGFIYTVWRYMAYGSRADLAYTVNAEGTLELSASIAELEDILLPRQSRDASLFIPSRSRSSATDIADALEKHINIKMLRMLVALGKGQLQLIPDDAKGMRLSLTLPKW